MIIYMITNKINGKQYVGQTVRSLLARWNSHCSSSSGCLRIKSAINKYGPENFEIKVLSRCNSTEEMNHRETYYINLFNTLSPKGYNLKTGGVTSQFSEETRAKMSESRKKYRHSEETNKRGGRTRSGSGNWAYGKKFSEEHKKQLSLAHMGISSHPKTKVMRHDTGKIYQSVNEAAEDIGVDASCISAVINGRRKHTKGIFLSKVL